MVVHRDLAWVSKIAPIAQLLEMIGSCEQCEVRTTEVFQVAAKDLWETYWYLSARINDEIVEANGMNYNEEYFKTIDGMAKRFVEK